MLVLMRGWSGSGKSYHVQKFMKAHPGSLAYSTDDFWSMDGAYRFDRERLNEAHAWNINRVRLTLKESAGLFRGKERHIFIDNVNIKVMHMQSYIDLAKQHDVQVCQFVSPSVAGTVNRWRALCGRDDKQKALLDVYSCWRRSTHAVPLSTMVRWMEEFEIDDSIEYVLLNHQQSENL